MHLIYIERNVIKLCLLSVSTLFISAIFMIYYLLFSYIKSPLLTYPNIARFLVYI